MEDERRRTYPQRRFAVPPEGAEVILVRHGASAAFEGEPFRLIDGHADPPLSPEGLEQAERVAARLADESLAGLVVSGLQRTVQTAQPLVERTGLQPHVIPQLREVMLGEWEGGVLRMKMAHRDPVALRVLSEERWDVIPGAEDPDRFTARVRAGVEEALTIADGGGRTVAAFVHGGVIGEICRQATGSRPLAFIHADNGSLTRLVALPDGRWLLRSFNETAHLDQAGAPAKLTSRTP